MSRCAYQAGIGWRTVTMRGKKAGCEVYPASRRFVGGRLGRGY